MRTYMSICAIKVVTSSTLPNSRNPLTPPQVKNREQMLLRQATSVYVIASAPPAQIPMAK